MDRKACVYEGRSAYIDIYHSLGDEKIQFLGGKGRFAGSESGAKMIFECADHTFGGVAAVGVREDKLEVNVVFAEEFLHFVGALVIKDVESGSCTIMT